MDEDGNIVHITGIADGVNNQTVIKRVLDKVTCVTHNGTDFAYEYDLRNSKITIGENFRQTVYA